MTQNMTQRHLVPVHSAAPGQGSDHAKGEAGGAKNHGFRALGGECLLQFEEEMKKIRWHILGLCEMLRKWEDTVTLESGQGQRRTKVR
ncbi:unnamed protein product [Euphydryas editha]|uniref:Uncharacterized protein n=1 Tax=Euphydryas editha TaxID=104508 RepID=A0AAU9U6Y3_EUPED|nr:unnamed protein product [Euphydryas editha]